MAGVPPPPIDNLRVEDYTLIWTAPDLARYSIELYYITCSPLCADGNGSSRIDNLHVYLSGE